MDLLNEIEETIYKWYPINAFSDDDYYQSQDYVNLRKLIEARHSDRSLITSFIEKLKTRFISIKIEDMIMGMDFPCYIIQIISYQDAKSIRAILLYISFIYPAYTCLCLEMNSPIWKVNEVMPNLIEEQIISELSELTMKHFDVINIDKGIYGKVLDGIWLRSEFRIFDALYTTGLKIV